MGLISRRRFLLRCRHLEDGQVFLYGSFVVLKCLLSLFLLSGGLSIASCLDLGNDLEKDLAFQDLLGYGLAIFIILLFTK